MLPHDAHLVDEDPITSPVCTKLRHISETPFTLTNWHEHIDWLNTTVVAILPIIGLISAYFTPLRQGTAIFAIIYYFTTGLGITAGTIGLSFLKSYLYPAQT